MRTTTIMTIAFAVLVSVQLQRHQLPKAKDSLALLAFDYSRPSSIIKFLPIWSAHGLSGAAIFQKTPILIQTELSESSGILIITD